MVVLRVFTFCLVVGLLGLGNAQDGAEDQEIDPFADTLNPVMTSGKTYKFKLPSGVDPNNFDISKLNLPPGVDLKSVKIQKIPGQKFQIPSDPGMSYEKQNTFQLPPGVDLDHLDLSKLNLPPGVDLSKLKIQQIPGERTYHMNIPKDGQTTGVYSIVNLIYNYFAAGGHLTGVPALDLLLLRYYGAQGPRSFCPK